MSAAADELHVAMRRYRRDRWWFLGGQRLKRAPRPPRGHKWSSPPQALDLRTQVVGAHTLSYGEAPDLSCTIRATWGGGKPPVILVGFRKGRTKPLTVQVDLYGEWRRAGRLKSSTSKELSKPDSLLASDLPEGWVKGPTPKELSPKERQALWKRYLRAKRKVTLQRGSRDWKIWWIDPDKTPREATRFVLLLYLWQVGMLFLSPGQAAWAFAKKFLRSKDNGTLLLILQSLRTHYALPQHWKELRVYIKRVIRDLAAQNAERRDAIADHYGISRRTFYRWISQGRVPRNGKEPLDEQGWAVVQQLAEQRALRRAAVRLLENSGKSRDAARKMIHRRLQAEESLETMVRSLRRGKRP